MADLLHVVCGLITWKDRILLSQRAPDHDRAFPYQWCLPGGKCEAVDGDLEPPAIALRREMLEELGFTVEEWQDYRLIHQEHFDQPIVRVPCWIYYFHVVVAGRHLPDFRLDTEETVGIGLFTLHEIDLLSPICTPGTRALFESNWGQIASLLEPAV